MVVKLSKVRNNQYSNIRSQRLNTLLLYADGHTHSETYQRALRMGVSKRTAKSYLKTLVIHIGKGKPKPFENSLLEPKRSKHNPFDNSEEIIGAGSDLLLDQ